MFFFWFVLCCFSWPVITAASMMRGLCSVYRTLYPVRQGLPQQLVSFSNRCSAFCGGDAAFSPHIGAAGGETVQHWCWINPDWPDCMTIIKLREAWDRPDTFLHNFSPLISSHIAFWTALSLSLIEPSLSFSPAVSSSNLLSKIFRISQFFISMFPSPALCPLDI